SCILYFFFQAEDGIRDRNVTGVQTCALPICHLFSVSLVSIPYGGKFCFRVFFSIFCISMCMHVSKTNESYFHNDSLLCIAIGSQIGRASCRERVWILVVAV